MMYRDDDKLAGMLAVIEEQQAAAGLAIDRLTTIVESLAELGGADWQQRVAADTAQRVAGQMESKCRAAIDAATKGARAKIQQDMQAAAQNVEKGAQHMEAVTGKAASAADKLEKSLYKAMLVPLLATVLIGGAYAGWAHWTASSAKKEAEALALDIQLMKQNQEMLERDPLLRMKITKCNVDGTMRWCVRTDETKGGGIAWGEGGKTYRIIHGLPPAE